MDVRPGSARSADSSNVVGARDGPTETAVEKTGCRLAGEERVAATVVPA